MVRMRARLLYPVRPGLAFQLEELRMIGKSAVGANGQHRYRARTVICHDQELFVRTQSLMDTVCATGVRLPQRFDLSITRIYGKRRRVALIAVHGVKESLVAIEDQKRGVSKAIKALNMRPRTGFRVYVECVDAVATAVPLGSGIAANVGADV